MNYKELNLYNRKKMKGVCNSQIEMEWEDSEIMDTLLGEIPKMKSVRQKEEISELVSQLEALHKTYDCYKSNKDDFLEQLKLLVDSIREVDRYWYGLDVGSVHTAIGMHKFCLISGDGGIGKSYFVKCLEEELESKGVEHLCIYGKFQKNIDEISVDEIVSVASNQTFVFIVDALNEMPYSTQSELVKLLETLKKIHGVRIIVTYRTRTVREEVLNQLQRIAEECYIFPGVSYESALAQLGKCPIIDVYKYEDILYSNNPMLLNMLCKILTDYKLIGETENSVSSITYILEQYLKKGLNDKEIWDNTKKVSNWMYRNDKKWIGHVTLMQLINNPTRYIEHLEQQGLLTEFQTQEGPAYAFAIDTLTDFLLARNLWNDFDKENISDNIELLKRKVDELYGIEEVAIIALFDKYGPNYAFIKEILVSTGLMERFSYETLLKIRFLEGTIQSFNEVFKTGRPDEMILHFGGYTDKPFNCVNYINEYYFSNGERQCKSLSQGLSGTYIQGRVKERLKNILYFINIRTDCKKRFEEAFYFALWCSAAPNDDVRFLAMKLMFDIVKKEKNYRKVLIDIFASISDDYIKEAIVYVICSLPKKGETESLFLKTIALDESFVMSKSLKRVADALGDKHAYINWNKENRFCCEEGNEISEDLNCLLSQVDLHEKDLLEFRYWGKSHVDMRTKFLAADKKVISEWNAFLKDEFVCIKQNGDCNGSLAFEDKVNKRFDKDYGKCLDTTAFLCSFESTIKKVFEKYGVLYSVAERRNRGEREFSNSLFRKAICIAQDQFYGSIMCNYYTNEFGTFNNISCTIGYEVYNPLEYKEEMRIRTPLPVFQREVESLGDYIVSKMHLPLKADEKWVKDTRITEENLKVLAQPVVMNNHQWVMIAGRFFFHRDGADWHEWNEHYDYWCCTSNEVTIMGDRDDRYLTIELDEYSGNLEEYVLCDEKPYLCKLVPVINSGSEVFDETYLVLPPVTLIKDLGLHICLESMTWKDENENIIMYCNNNKHSYYHDFHGGTVFFRKDIYDKYVENHTLKFFAFSEKYIPSTGYARESSLHFEIEKGRIKKNYYNYLENPSVKEAAVQENSCETCPYGFQEDWSKNIPLRFFLKFGENDEEDAIEEWSE